MSTTKFCIRCGVAYHEGYIHYYEDDIKYSEGNTKYCGSCQKKVEMQMKVNEHKGKKCIRPGCINSVPKAKGRRRKSSFWYKNFCNQCNQMAYKRAKEFNMSKSTAKLLMIRDGKKWNKKNGKRVFTKSKKSHHAKQLHCSIS